MRPGDAHNEERGVAPEAAGVRPAPAGNVLRRAGVQAAIMAAMGAFLLAAGRRGPGLTLLVLAGALFLGGLLVPPLFLRCERAGRRIGRLVGLALTWILLPLFFYLSFVPARIMLALRRRDPLGRRFPTALPTYWVDRPATGDKETYRRQYG